MNDDYRKDFPLLRDSNVIYFDNAATTQKPQCVIDAVNDYYKKDNSNPLRGVYDLSVRATEDYENARETVAEFIGAKDRREVIFTRNATESINLVAFSYGRYNINKDDEVVITIAEHHSNIIPWQQLCREKGAILKYIYCDKDGKLDVEDIKKVINSKTKILSITQVSNVLGVVNDIKSIVKIAHDNGAIVLVDGSQSVPHMVVDVQDLNVDFLAFSGHKMMGPMGIGVLYGKSNILEDMNPFLTGGEMIEYVTEQFATFDDIPHKFEAGTVNCGGAVGLDAAIKYINKVGFKYIREQEDNLTKKIIEGLKSINDIEIIGSNDYKDHQGIVGFNVKGVHPHDAASILNEYNIAVRAGHHCAQPLMKYFNINSCLRASVYFYNTEEEVEMFLSRVNDIRRWI